MTRAKKTKKKMSNCPHVTACHKSLSHHVIAASSKSKCKSCNETIGQLWMCVVCLRTYGTHGGGYGDHSDHIYVHFEYSGHCLAVNLVSRRFWCFICDTELVEGENSPEFRVAKHGAIPVDWDSLTGEAVLEEPPKGLVGLRNLGNTCYMNSALQCLSNCHPMTSYFLEFMYKDENKAPLSTAYKKLIMEMWRERGPTVAIPSGLLGIIKLVNPSFRGYMQQDTQELLRCLIDHLHEELKHVVTFDPPYHRSAPTDSALADSAHTDSNGQGSSIEENRPVVKYTSIIADLFNGLIKSSVRCLTCDKVSVTTEAFQDLSLPIPSGDQLTRLHSKADTSTQVPSSADTGGSYYTGSYLSWIFAPFVFLYNLPSRWQGDAVTLDDCFSAFFSPDDLTGDNMYSCENCKKLRNGLKEVSIVKLPEVMCIHLKRFRHDLMTSSKINSRVSFPITNLDISPYMRQGAWNVADDCTYNLTGVICHHGSVSGGHYTAYALHPATHTWYEYDDSYISQVTVETVKQCQAYVLFYTRDSSSQRIYKNRILRQLQEVHKPSLLQFYVSRKWLFKFFTCKDPGPISNSSDFLCVHGSVRPTHNDSIQEEVVALSDKDWGTLLARYGGGPAVNTLVKCEACQATLDSIRVRQELEHRTFLVKKNRPTNNLYAISMTWFRKWEAFVEGQTDTPPGAVNNKAIVTDKTTVVNNRGRKVEVRVLRRRADYGTLNGSLWRFLTGIYGGGPEALYSFGPNDHSDISDEEEEGESYGEMVQPSGSSTLVSPVQSHDSLHTDNLDSSANTLQSADNKRIRQPVEVHSSQSEPTVIAKSSQSQPMTVIRSQSSTTTKSKSDNYIISQSVSASASSSCGKPNEVSELTAVASSSTSGVNTRSMSEDQGTLTSTVTPPSTGTPPSTSTVTPPSTGTPPSTVTPPSVATPPPSPRNKRRKTKVKTGSKSETLVVSSAPMDAVKSRSEGQLTNQLAPTANRF